jgi:hypothetical protein
MSAPTTPAPAAILSSRALSILRAVEAGRVGLACSREPDLFIDGVALCDQFTGHLLTHDGLIAPVRAGLIGERVPVVLTEAGRMALGLSAA